MAIYCIPSSLEGRGKQSIWSHCCFERSEMTLNHTGWGPHMCFWIYQPLLREERSGLLPWQGFNQNNSRPAAGGRMNQDIFSLNYTPSSVLFFILKISSHEKLGSWCKTGVLLPWLWSNQVRERVDVTTLCTWEPAPVLCWNVVVPNQNLQSIVCHIRHVPVVMLFSFIGLYKYLQSHYK